MLSWLTTSAPNRRRTAAQWDNHEVNQAAEVLEVRVVPARSSFPGGQLNPAPGSNLPDTTIKIYPRDKGRQYADVNIPGIGGAFSVKIQVNKHGIGEFKSVTKHDISGKLFVIPDDDDPSHTKFHISGVIRSPFGDVSVNDDFILTPSQS